MVYVDPKNLGYKPYWDRWVNAISAENDQKEFIRLFDKYISYCIAYILEGIVDGRQSERLKTIVPLSNLNMVSTTRFPPLPTYPPTLTCPLPPTPYPPTNELPQVS